MLFFQQHYKEMDLEENAFMSFNEDERKYTIGEFTDNKNLESQYNALKLHGFTMVKSGVKVAPV